MATRKRTNTDKSVRVKAGDKQQRKKPIKTNDREVIQRGASTILDAKDEIRVRNKKAYRDSKDDLALLAGKELFAPPKPRDVQVYDTYQSVQCYSIVMAAEALGKSVIQLRQWIKKEYIPAPTLIVKGHGYLVYDEREMQIIRKHLYMQTLKGVSYLTKNSIDFIHRLNEEIWEHRGDKYGNTKKKKSI